MEQMLKSQEADHIEGYCLYQTACHLKYWELNFNLKHTSKILDKYIPSNSIISNVTAIIKLTNFLNIESKLNLTNIGQTVIELLDLIAKKLGKCC